ncbi:MAG: hypothetical protein J7K14_06885 [Sulfurimonas sp.]|nr:hypothetical protein [Sulfurimonas sp.]
MKIFVSILLILVLVLSLAFEIDERAIVIQDAAFDRAMIAFGLAKGLNAVISLIQGTELSFTPVGVGLNFSVGEVLDPFNDMVERFSWVMLLATVSLGIQKIILLLSSKIFIQVALGISVALSLAFIWVKEIKNSLFLSYSLKLFVLMLLLRFSAIIFVFISQEFYTSTLQIQYTEASSIIENTRVELEALQSKSKTLVQAQKQEGFFGNVSSKYDKVIESLNISRQLDTLQNSIENASRNIITLITIFIVQSVVLPLLYLWMLVISVKLIFRSEFTSQQLNRVYNS